MRFRILAVVLTVASVFLVGLARAEEHRDLVSDTFTPPDPSVLYAAGDRWVMTAHGPAGEQGDPVVLTYSFAPDGLEIPEYFTLPFMEPGPNILHETMAGVFGRAWKDIFRQAFERWDAVSGITFREEPGDMEPFFFTPGEVGNRGDIRIAMRPFSSNNPAAAGLDPDVGEVVLNSLVVWDAVNNGDYRFMKNVLMHEIGHALGLDHVFPSNGTKLMEPLTNVGFLGPQDDDIRGIERLYGDRFENDDSATDATPLPSIVSFTPSIRDISIDSDVDEDWFGLDVGGPMLLDLVLSPIGSDYELTSGERDLAVAVAGPFAYIVSDFYPNTLFKVIDVADASKPLKVAELVVDLLNPGTMVVVGDLAYLGGSGGLRIIDVSDPLSPVLLGAVSGLSGSGLDVEGDYAYTTRNSVIKIFDVSDPMNPVQVWSTTRPGHTFNAVDVQGDLLYVAHGARGLRIYDVSDRSNPVVTDDEDTPGYAFDVEVDGDVAYIADDSGGLRTIDVSDPYDLVPLNSVTTIGEPFRIDLSGQFVYVADILGSAGFLTIVDKTTLSVVGSRTSSGAPQEVAVGGGHAYVVVDKPGIDEVVTSIFDVSNPASPVFLTTATRIDTRLIQNLDIEIWTGDGVTLIHTVAEADIGESEQLDDFLLQPGSYGLRVVGAGLDDVQRYEMEWMLSPSGLFGFASGGSSVGVSVHPNPFNPTAVVRFNAPKAGPVTLQVYDVQGREVFKETLTAGQQGPMEMSWDAVNNLGQRAASGVYYLRVTADRVQATARAVLLK